jgi:hypothetical protein
VRTSSDVQNGSSTRIISSDDLAIGSVARRCAIGKASSRQMTVMIAEIRKVLKNR